MGADIPACLAPRAEVSTPRFRPPPGSWDTHFHVLGPVERYPYSPTRKYTPPDAPLTAYLALMKRLGLDRAVVVHPNLHGYDNSVDLDAMAAGGGRFKGVVRLAGNVTEREVQAMHEAGVRGVRFAFNPQHGGALDMEVFRRVVDCVGSLGWFIELHMAPESLVSLREWLETIALPVVIDHMGRVDVSLGTAQAPFRALLELMRRDNFWVKVSGADRISRTGAPYADVVPFARALIDAAPDRVLWGSDWPHTGVLSLERMPNDGDLLDLLLDFAPDEAVRNRILVTNPNRLLGEP